MMQYFSIQEECAALHLVFVIFDILLFNNLFLWTWALASLNMYK